MMWINKPTHGHFVGGRPTPTYRSWSAMRTRCTNTKHEHHDRYVGLCDERWASFDTFLSDMGERPAGTTLERVNNELGYAPGNCRWATRAEQARNRRNTRLDWDKVREIRHLSRDRGLTHQAIADYYGVDRSLVSQVIRGVIWQGG